MAKKEKKAAAKAPEKAPEKAPDKTDQMPKTVGPIHNEKQETMFDTEMSVAVDDMIDAVKMKAVAKANHEKCERALIEVMLKFKTRLLTFETGHIDLNFVESMEKIKVCFDKNS